MRKVMFTVLAVLFALLMASPARAQAQHTPRGKALDISKAEIEATVQKTASAPVSSSAGVTGSSPCGSSARTF